MADAPLLRKQATLNGLPQIKISQRIRMSTTFLVAHVICLIATVGCLAYAFAPSGGTPRSVRAIEWGILAVISVDIALGVAQHGLRSAFCGKPRRPLTEPAPCGPCCAPHCVANVASAVLGLTSVALLLVPDRLLGGIDEDEQITGALLIARSGFYTVFIFLEARSVVAMRGGAAQMLGMSPSGDWDVRSSSIDSAWSEGFS